MEEKKELVVRDVMPILEHEPKEIMEQVVKVANALTDVVTKAGLSKKFGGEKSHLYYEAWQTVAGFFSHSVKTLDATPVEVNGVRGAKARAVLYNRDGVEIGGAEAYCMQDEKNWSSKPFFQLASMAQTRAGSKALRNKFAWVAVLGGYAGTPAEEMESVEPETPPPPPPSFEELYNRMQEIKNVHELKAWWLKHQGEFKALPKDQFDELAKAKDFMKSKFEEVK